jgi:hypothetical protein
VVVIIAVTPTGGLLSGQAASVTVRLGSAYHNRASGETVSLISDTTLAMDLEQLGSCKGFHTTVQFSVP